MCLQVPEVTINIVTYDMVQQYIFSQLRISQGVNEFIKAGFTPEPSTLIKPPMVKESKVKMECNVMEIKPLGNEAGAGSLVICQVIRMHIDLISHWILSAKRSINENFIMLQAWRRLVLCRE